MIDFTGPLPKGHMRLKIGLFDDSFQAQGDAKWVSRMSDDFMRGVLPCKRCGNKHWTDEHRQECWKKWASAALKAVGHEVKK